MHYLTRTNYGALLHSSMSMTDNTIQYHSRHLIEGVMPNQLSLFKLFLIPNFTNIVIEALQKLKVS